MNKWMITAAVLIAASPVYAETVPSADLPCAIVLDLLNMRAGPGVNYPVVNQLRPGNILSVIDGFINGWQHVQIYEGDGWISANYIQPVECPPPPDHTAHVPPPPSSPPEYEPLVAWDAPTNAGGDASREPGRGGK